MNPSSWLWLLPLGLLALACGIYVQQFGARKLWRLVASLPFLAAFIQHQVGWLLMQELGGLHVREADVAGTTDIQSPSAYVFLVGIAMSVIALAMGDHVNQHVSTTSFRFAALKLGIFTVFVALALGIGRGWWLTLLGVLWVGVAWLVDHFFGMRLTHQPRYWQHVGLLTLLYFALWVVLVRYWPQAIVINPTTQVNLLILGVPIELLGTAYGWLSMVYALGTVSRNW